jgi:hypothetical protein
MRTGLSLDQRSLEQRSANVLRFADEMAGGVAHHELRVDRRHSQRCCLLNNIERGSASVWATLLKDSKDIVLAIALYHGREIKHVTRLKIPPAEIDLLGDNFHRCLQPHGSAPHLAYVVRIVDDRWCANEVDLAEIHISELEDACAIAVIAIGPPFQRNVLGLGIEERQDLRVVKKQINVMALTMVNLEHQCSAAAKAPMGHEPDATLNMVQDADSQVEEDRPLTRPVGSHAGYAANGSV